MLQRPAVLRDGRTHQLAVALLQRLTVCFTAVSINSRSPWSSGAACCSARPFCFTAVSINSRSPWSSGDKNCSMEPSCEMAATAASRSVLSNPLAVSTSSRSLWSSGAACCSARPFCFTAVRTSAIALELRRGVLQRLAVLLHGRKHKLAVALELWRGVLQDTVRLEARRLPERGERRLPERILLSPPPARMR